MSIHCCNVPNFNPIIYKNTIKASYTPHSRLKILQTLRRSHPTPRQPQVHPSVTPDSRLTHLVSRARSSRLRTKMKIKRSPGGRYGPRTLAPPPPVSFRPRSVKGINVGSSHVARYIAARGAFQAGSQRTCPPPPPAFRKLTGAHGSGRRFGSCTGASPIERLFRPSGGAASGRFAEMWAVLFCGRIFLEAGRYGFFRSWRSN